MEIQERVKQLIFDNSKNLEILKSIYMENYIELLGGPLYRWTRKISNAIYDVACPQWKLKIEELNKDILINFMDEGYISHSIVRRMFEAASPSQSHILADLFPNFGQWNALIEASESGKSIEVFRNGIWETKTSFFWNKDISKYRIKPQEEYVPYEYSDAQDILGSKIRSKDGNVHKIVYSVTEEGVFSPKENGWMLVRVSFTHMFEHFEYLDGTPFGKLKK